MIFLLKNRFLGLSTGWNDISSVLHVRSMLDSSLFSLSLHIQSRQSLDCFPYVCLPSSSSQSLLRPCDDHGDHLSLSLSLGGGRELKVYLLKFLFEKKNDFMLLVCDAIDAASHFKGFNSLLIVFFVFRVCSRSPLFSLARSIHPILNISRSKTRRCWRSERYIIHKKIRKNKRTTKSLPH